MALSESLVADRCDVLEDLTIIARMALVIQRDGIEISRERAAPQVYPRGSDVSAAPARVRDLATRLWE